MKKQLVIIGIITLLVTVGLSGCDQVSNTQNPEKNKFVGTWRNSDLINYTMDLSSDGTFSTSWSLYGTWDLKDGKFVLDFIEPNLSYTYAYAFSNNNRILTLNLTSENIIYVYTKQ